MRQYTVSYIIFLLILISSCTINREQVGNYNNIKGNTTTYLKGKNIYLFWDQVQLQGIEKKLTIKNYEKIVKRNFFDSVVYFGTFGVFSFYTVKIKIKNNQDVQKTSSNSKPD